MRDKLFERALNDLCPICGKHLEEETEIVDYKKGKLKIDKKHIKYKR